MKLLSKELKEYFDFYKMCYMYLYYFN